MGLWNRIFKQRHAGSTVYTSDEARELVERRWRKRDSDEVQNTLSAIERLEKTKSAILKVESENRKALISEIKEMQELMPPSDDGGDSSNPDFLQVLMTRLLLNSGTGTMPSLVQSPVITSNTHTAAAESEIPKLLFRLKPLLQNPKYREMMLNYVPDDEITELERFIKSKEPLEVQHG